jgi:dTMP kinase
MKKMSYLVTFEGIEGSGKSTQIELFKKLLITQNLQVIQLREPGSTEFGEKLREVILNQKQPVSPIAEALLFSTARAELIHQKITPLLEQENTVVLLDRYIDSTYAYQGTPRED